MVQKAFSLPVFLKVALLLERANSITWLAQTFRLLFYSRMAGNAANQARACWLIAIFGTRPLDEGIGVDGSGIGGSPPPENNNTVSIMTTIR